MADARHAVAGQDTHAIALAKAFIGGLGHRDQASRIEPDGNFKAGFARYGFFRRRAAQALYAAKDNGRNCVKRA